MNASKEFSGPPNLSVLDEADGMIAWSGRCPDCRESMRYIRYTEYSPDDKVVTTFLPCELCGVRSDVVFTRKPSALSEDAGRFRDHMVGTWEMDGDTYLVFVSEEGGLEAQSLTTGKPVGAGLPISGNKIGPLPADFTPPTK